MTLVDTVVVGAGPGGCMTAQRLACGGVSTLLVEQATLPRYKTCGGGVLRRAFDLLPASAARAVEGTFHSMQLHLNDQGLYLEAKRDSPIVYMTMRATLDHALAEEAVAAGSALRQGCTVTGLRRSGDFWETETSAGTIRSKHVVAADGTNSRIAKLLNWSDGRELAPAVEYEIKVSDACMEKFAGAVRFDFGTIDGGYAWVFPKREHLSIGVGGFSRGRAVNLHEATQRYLTMLGITEVKSCEKHGYAIPISPRKGPLARDGVFLVGDAAGLADPITAEGITHAAKSGILAGDAIAGTNTTADAEQEYRQSLEAEVLSELAPARALAPILYRRPMIRNLAFRLAGAKLCSFAASLAMGEARYAMLRSPKSYLKALRFVTRPSRR